MRWILITVAFLAHCFGKWQLSLLHVQRSDNPKEQIAKGEYLCTVLAFAFKFNMI